MALISRNRCWRCYFPAIYLLSLSFSQSFFGSDKSGHTISMALTYIHGVSDNLHSILVDLPTACLQCISPLATSCLYRIGIALGVELKSDKYNQPNSSYRAIYDVSLALWPHHEQKTCFIKKYDFWKSSVTLLCKSVGVLWHQIIP